MTKPDNLKSERVIWRGIVNGVLEKGSARAEAAA